MDRPPPQSPPPRHPCATSLPSSSPSSPSLPTTHSATNSSEDEAPPLAGLADALLAATNRPNHTRPTAPRVPSPSMRCVRSTPCSWASSSMSSATSTRSPPLSAPRPRSPTSSCLPPPCATSFASGGWPPPTPSWTGHLGRLDRPQVVMPAAAMEMTAILSEHGAQMGEEGLSAATTEGDGGSIMVRSREEAISRGRSVISRT
ncbi:hypothetical protein ACP4OV_016929 [Aristida adscensionis]